MSPMLKTKLIVATFITGLVAYYVLTPPVQRNLWWECDKVPEQIAAISPDQKWVARGITLACGGFGAASLTDYIVLVEPGMEPTLGDEILEGSWPGMNSARLKWQDTNHLQITIPKSSSVSQHRTVHKGVTVDLQF